MYPECDPEVSDCYTYRRFTNMARTQTYLAGICLPVLRLA